MASGSDADLEDVMSPPARIGRRNAVLLDSDEERGSAPLEGSLRTQTPSGTARRRLDLESNEPASRLRRLRRGSKTGLEENEESLASPRPRIQREKATRSKPTRLRLQDNQLRWTGSDRRSGSRSGSSAPGSPSRSVSGQQSPSRENDLSDFIVEDPEGALEGQDEGVRTLLTKMGVHTLDMPEECFPEYMDFLTRCMVHALVHPEDATGLEADGKTQQICKKVEAQLHIKREMCVQSEAWKGAAKGFIPALVSLPEVYLQGLHDNQEMYNCGACNKPKAHASKVISFSGIPYQPEWGPSRPLVESQSQGEGRPHWLQDYRSTAADFGNQTDEEEDGDFGEPGPSFRRPPAPRQEMKVFTIGSWCAARVRLYHSLLHFKHHLQEGLYNWLSRNYKVEDIENEVVSEEHVVDRLRDDRYFVKEQKEKYCTLLTMAEKYLRGEGGTSADWKKESGKFSQIHSELERMWVTGSRGWSKRQWRVRHSRSASTPKRGSPRHPRASNPLPRTSPPSSTSPLRPPSSPRIQGRGADLFLSPATGIASSRPHHLRQSTLQFKKRLRSPASPAREAPISISTTSGESGPPASKRTATRDEHALPEKGRGTTGGQSSLDGSEGNQSEGRETPQVDSGAGQAPVGVGGAALALGAALQAYREVATLPELRNEEASKAKEQCWNSVSDLRCLLGSGSVANARVTAMSSISELFMELCFHLRSAQRESERSRSQRQATSHCLEILEEIGKRLE